MRPRALGLLALLVLGDACVVVDPLTKQPVSGPEWHAKNIAGYGETVAGRPPDRMYAWDLRIVANVAHWRECRSLVVCTDIHHERPAADLLAFKRIARTSMGDSGDIDVLELSLAPRPGYIVPSRDVMPTR